VVCNPSIRDKAGWDYILESSPTYRIAADADRPLDLAATALQCLVQVKATDRHNVSIPVKLSNWDRLVKGPLPAFFLILEYDGELEPQRAYAVHVDEVWIRAVLERERKLGPGSAQQLHKKTLSLTYSEADRLPTLTGTALWDAITRVVGDPAEYHRTKAQWKQTVGYEGNPKRITGELILDLDKGQAPEEALVDFALGIRPRASVRDLMEIDMRFGIAAPPVRVQVGHTEGFAVRSVLVDGRDVVMTVHPPDPRFGARIPLKLYVPPIKALGVDDRFAKLRLIGRGVDVVIQPSAGTGNLNLTLPKRFLYQRLTDLRPFARLTRAIAQAQDGGTNLGFTLTVNGQDWQGRFGVRDAELSFVPLMEVLLLAHEIADLCQIEGAEATLESLSRQRTLIQGVHSLLLDRPLNMYAKVNAELADRAGPVAVLPPAIMLELGSHRLYFVIVLYGDPEALRREGDVCTVYSTDIRILKQEVHRGEHSPEAIASRMIGAAAQQLASFEGSVVIPNDSETLL
jgi:hypothetical protein